MIVRKKDIVDSVLGIRFSGRWLAAYQFVAFTKKVSGWEFQNLLLCENAKFHFEHELHELSDIEQMVRESVLTFNPPKSGSLNLPNALWCRYDRFVSRGTDGDVLLELRGIVGEIERGDENCVDKCTRLWLEYQSEESDEKLLGVRESYQRVPEHLICWLGRHEGDHVTIAELVRR